jgi:hypothetical protein
VFLHPPGRDLKSATTRVAACLLIFLILALATVSAAASLHRSLHRVAGTSEQGCAICLFAHSRVFQADCAPAVIVPAPQNFEHVSPPRVAEVASFDYQLLPSRAPPSDRSCCSA